MHFYHFILTLLFTPTQVPHPEPEMPLISDAEEEGLSDESDVDDFIVDDNGEPISKPQKGMKRRSKGDS